MNFIQRLVNNKQIKKLEEEIQDLKVELAKRQEAINKTNAYWKKKMSIEQKKQSKL